MRSRLVASVFVLVFGIAISTHATDDNVPFMKVDELKELLKRGPIAGRFETVISGVEISKFDLSVKDIYTDLSGTVIPIFTTDEYIVAGMSGSPVYVLGLDGQEKKLGGLAYRFGEFPIKEKWGGISPIEYMDNEASGLFEYLSQKMHNEQNIPQSFRHRGMLFESIPLANNMLSHQNISEGVYKVLRGLSGVTFSTVGQSDSGTINTQKALTGLHAGMPITVDLIEWGNLVDESETTLSASGTITHVGPQGQIYAFGHPFLGGQIVRYRFRGCRIVGNVLDQSGSFRLHSEVSEPLGLIRFDGRYGIYGQINPEETQVAERFLVQYDWNNQPEAAFSINVAQAPIMPTLISLALEVAGAMAGVPAEQKSSMTEMSGTVTLDDESKVEFEDITMSSRTSFGPDMIYTSSYKAAYESFVERIVLPLLHNPFDISVAFYKLHFNFTRGTQKVLYMAAANFPSKVIYGSVPELEVVLVSKDGSQLFSRKIPVQIDWSKVEKPKYTISTKDTEKKPEKVINGLVRVVDVSNRMEYLRNDEKEAVKPSYFLSRNDYLESFREQTKATNRKLYVRTVVRRRSGKADESSDENKSIIPSGGEVKDGWTVHSEGLSVRSITKADFGEVAFYADLEPIPGGYMLSRIDTPYPFEVVLDDEK